MKKVLIISYYWPPAGGPGVQRVVKFTKHLPSFGWQPIVLTIKNPTSPAIDESLLNAVPEDCLVYKTSGLEPFNLYRRFTGKEKDATLAKDIISKRSQEKLSEKIARLIRANIFVPDARVGWIPSMVRHGVKIIKDHHPDVIFSTSPPHSLQLGAKKLAKISGLKWIADFRDPWSEAYWDSEIDKIRLIHKLNISLEKSVLKNANLITTVSKNLIEIFSQKVENRYDFIYNGFDSANTEKINTDKFKIVFLGNLSKYQSPLSFLEAVNSLPDKIKSKIDITFIGKVFEDYVKLFDNYPNIQVNIKAYMPFQSMMNHAKEASILLLILHKTTYTQGYMTAKIYDYLALRKPILALGQPGSTIDNLLHETESGKLFDYNNIESISKNICDEFERWSDRGYVLLPSIEALDNYKTITNVKKLVHLFEEINN